MARNDATARWALDQMAAFTDAVADCQEAEPLLLETMRRDTDALTAAAIARGCDATVMLRLIKAHRGELRLAKSIGLRSTKNTLIVLAHARIQARLRARIQDPWAKFEPQVTTRDAAPLDYLLQVASRLAASRPALPAAYTNVTLEAES
jgi:hypothetical protein